MSTTFIELGNGFKCMVDMADMSELSKYKWRFSTTANRNARNPKTYAIATIPYGSSGRFVGVRRPQRIIKMHAFLLNPPSGLTVDHINGNTLDNRRCNLRLATPQQQKANSFAVKGKKYKGVCKYIQKGKDTGRWRAQIEVNGKNRHIGYFSSEESAAAAYNVEALKAFGSFAKLNEVPS